jgi:uncharacterized protein with PIN domain
VRDYHPGNSFNSLFTSILQYSDEFSKQNIAFLRRIGRKQVNGEGRDCKIGAARCIDCERIISEYRVEQLKEELKVSKFEDHYNLFNVDHLNFSEMTKLRRQSNNIIQSELLSNDN